MHLELLVEEQSIVPVLEIVLAQILREGDSYAIRVFQGKPDLLRQLPKRIKGYEWRSSESDFAIFVVVDRDGDDCKELKQRIQSRYAQTNFVTKSSGATSWNIAERIVIEEMEAWLFGDWEAVIAAFPRVPSSVPKRAKYRQVDAIQGGTAEALQRILTGAGYNFAESKTLVSAQVARHMVVTRNISPSFKTFCSGISAALERSS